MKTTIIYQRYMKIRIPIYARILNLQYYIDKII